MSLPGLRERKKQPPRQPLHKVPLTTQNPPTDSGGDPKDETIRFIQLNRVRQAGDGFVELLRIEVRETLIVPKDGIVRL